MKNILCQALCFFWMIWVAESCNKITTAPNVSGVAAVSVINAIPNSNPVTPVFNTSSPITWFIDAQSIGYGYSSEYSPVAGNDSLYVVQNDDTLNINLKASIFMYNGILPLRISGIYSLYLCGADTSSPDYLFTTDTLPSYGPTDSVLGIRFVNLSTGSSPLSINLEGYPNGSVVGSLPYKGVTGFGQYVCNSSTSGYFFVVRDQASGDSLTQFNLNNVNQNGFLVDPMSGSLLWFRNVTIAIYGSETNINVPLNTMLIDNY